MRSIFLFIFTPLLISGCRNHTEKKLLDFNSFSIEVPYDWTKFELQGIDSFIGGITNGTDTLIFDYGKYSYSFEHEEPELHNYSLDTVDGKPALIIRPVAPGKGLLGIYIEKAKGDNRFNLIGRNVENENTVLNIFKSIRFENSDSSNISENFAENFEPYTQMKRNGKVFETNCACCHANNEKLMNGPGLLVMTKTSFDLWMTDTLPLPDSTMMEFVAGPSFHRNLGKEYTTEELSILREMFK